MAKGHDKYDDPKLTGLSRYFNNETLRGRANVAKVTYAVFGVLILYFMTRKKKMAGGSSVDESQLKGISKYFNGETVKGRANNRWAIGPDAPGVNSCLPAIAVARATYAFFGVVALYFTLKPKSKK